MSSKKDRRDRFVPDSEIEVNMTPMIDIVFQMILFFIIITDFTQQDIALLTLPFSTVGQDDAGDEPGRIIINVTAPRPTPEELLNPARAKDWPDKKLKQADKILIKERSYDFMGLSAYLENRGVKDKRYVEPDNPALSSRSVLIRCDGEQAFDYVKAILQICAQPDVAIYKIEIATSEKDEQ